MMNTLATLGVAWGIVSGIAHLSNQRETIADKFMKSHQRISKFFNWED
ncbi:hypothetical protein [Lacticaseibacillus saniviri]|nr:hypothetical protein [Lacticaseibacillus saniviri]MCG4280885.1 hypothetical protein [Lacticaseibacillus saniviri]